MRALAIFVVVLTGCAAKCHNCFYGHDVVTRYDVRECRDLPEGKFTCNHVIFDPRTRSAK